MLRPWRMITLVLAALSMALSLAHLMELPARITWDPLLWMASTNTGGLYRMFGTLGAVFDLGAVIAAIVLAIMVRRRHPAAGWTLAAAILLVIGHAAWWALVFPMNGIMADWPGDTQPVDFFAVRNQWEFSHAGIAVVKLVALGLLYWSVLAETARRRQPIGAAPPDC